MTNFKKINFFIVQCAHYTYAWRTAEKIAGNYLGRLAIVLMVLKAHCSNVTPNKIQVFKTAEDQKNVNTFTIIHAEDVSVVDYASKWFHFLCSADHI